MFKNLNSVELALAFQPILLFDPSERFYPIAAEEWLDHLATDPWDGKTNKRGSAVMVVDRNTTSFGDIDVQAGSHYPQVITWPSVISSLTASDKNLLLDLIRICLLMLQVGMMLCLLTIKATQKVLFNTLICYLGQ